MDTKKFLIAGFAGGVAAFVFGFLIWGFALFDFMESHNIAPPGAAKDPMNMLFLILGNLALGFLLAYIFERLAHIRAPRSGAVAGAVILFLMSLYFDSLTYAMMNLMDLAGLIVDVIASVIFGALTGAVVGWVLSAGRGGVAPAS